MLDKMYDNAVAEVISRCANDLQNQVALVGEVSDGIERLQDRALAYVSRSPTFEDADEDVKRQAAKFVVDDLFQLGPIEELLWDPEVSEIMVNSPDQVMVERRGKITLSDVHFFDEEHVQRTIARIVSSDGRRCDNQSPLCDCMLHRTGAPFDGSRVNAVAFGIAKHWTLDVRKFRNDALTPESLIANGSMDENMADFLQALVLARMNIVIEAAPARARPHCSTRSPTSSPTASASSRSRTPPSSTWRRATSCRSSPAPPTTRQGRDHAPAAGHQHAAPAPRPHRRRRVPRTRGFRHAPGHELGP